MSLLSFTKKIVGQKDQQPRRKKQAKAASEKKPEASTTAQPTTSAGLLGLTPLITEKTVGKTGQGTVVAFKVHPSATKGQIAVAIKERYQVTPAALRTLQMNPKIRRRGVSVGKTNAWKKVYVTLPAGSSIDLAV